MGEADTSTMGRLGWMTVAIGLFAMLAGRQGGIGVVVFGFLVLLIGRRWRPPLKPSDDEGRRARNRR
jgi:hypothetical protein